MVHEFREVETRVLPATLSNLTAFSAKELRLYADTLGLPKTRSKGETVAALVLSHKATILAQLGN